MSAVFALSDARCLDAERVGAKAATLARLQQSGFDVPPAVVVGVDEFRRHFPDAAPERPPAVRPRLAASLDRALDDAVRKLSDDAASLAVRSSALGEDGADRSFAGAHATLYYVAPENIAAAVADCWLSLWSQAALCYRRAGGDATAAGNAFAMAVIVQRMVQADRAGVCFSRDPSGALPEQALLEASWGLGASLVDGRVSADRFWIDENRTITRRHIGNKRFKVAERLLYTDGNRLEPVPRRQQSRPCLSDAEVLAVVRQTTLAEQLFGGPQDLEWAFENGRLYVLQSRAVTSLAPEPVRTDGRWVLFKPLAENFSEPLTPMTQDLYRRVLPALGRFIQGRLYLDLDLLRRLLPLHGGDAPLVRLALLQGDLAALRLDWRRLPLGLVALAAAFLSNGAYWLRSGRLATADLAAYERLCSDLAGRPEVDAAATLERLVLGRGPWEPAGRYAFQANVGAGRYFLMLALLRWLRTRWFAEVPVTVLEQACTGSETMLSREMVDAIAALASLARADVALKAALGAEQAPDPTELLNSVGHQHPFALAFAGFLRRFGHRGAREVELASPRWREDPASVLALVRAHLRAERTATQPHGLQLAARDRLHQSLPRGLRRWLVDRLLQGIRRHVALRENTRHYHSLAMATTRDKLRALEQTLLAEGRLRCVDDLFFLHWEEARDLAGGALDWREVEDRIRQRRLRHQRLARRAPPLTVNVDLPAAPATGQAAAGGVFLVGEGASAGTAEGPARVLFDPCLEDALRPGEVLVAPYTDPAWTPLFPAASAIVVEVGSFLSHAGTVAREYGIPCVVDVSGCTQRIRSGQRLRVDAALGRVEILD